MNGACLSLCINLSEMSGGYNPPAVLLSGVCNLSGAGVSMLSAYIKSQTTSRRFKAGLYQNNKVISISNKKAVQINLDGSRSIILLSLT